MSTGLGLLGKIGLILYFRPPQVHLLVCLRPIQEYVKRECISESSATSLTTISNLFGFKSRESLSRFSETPLRFSYAT